MPPLLSQAEELLGVRHAYGPGAGGFDVLIWAGDIGGGFEEPAGGPGEGQGVAVAGELDGGWHDFTSGQDDGGRSTARDIKPDLRQLL